MKIPIEAVRLKEPIQLGPTAADSIDVNDTNPMRSSHRAVTMELDDATGILTIGFRGKRRFVHLSCCRFATEKSEAQVTHIEPPAPEVDDEIEDDELPRAPVNFFAPQVSREEIRAAEDAPEVDDMPDDLPGKKVARGRGRSRE